MPSGGGEAGGGLSDIWAYLGTIGAAAAVVLANFVKTWRNSNGEEAATKQPRVVLEQAEFADVSEFRRLMVDLRPRLEQVYDVERANKTMLESNREKMDEILRGMRRLEAELDVEQRVRQEELLRRSRRDDQRDP